MKTLLISALCFSSIATFASESSDLPIMKVGQVTEASGNSDRPEIYTSCKFTLAKNNQGTLVAEVTGSDGEGGSGDVYKISNDYKNGKAEGVDSINGGFMFPRTKLYYKIKWDLNSHYATFSEKNFLGINGYSFTCTF